MPKFKICKCEFNCYKQLKPYCFELSWSSNGYFDGHSELTISLIFFTILIKLPFFNPKKSEMCFPVKKYGIAIHNSVFWVYTGGTLSGGTKWVTWEIPFFNFRHIKHEFLMKDGTWMEVPKDYKEEDKLFEDNSDGHLGEGFSKGCRKPTEESGIEYFEYDYLDKYDNTIIKSYFWTERREWRRKWLTWTTLFNYVRKSIAIEFTNEVGPRKGSWKGGVLGCGYDYKNDKETPMECMKRMERERQF